ncbi:MAG: hypothetical protein H6832_00635 [Planctomycetes bacterium]|nr:hypothetical protein [Planctomycetota bacterium]MCB9916889.1 hypothetical protein [Planctomycetota bacterium]
MSFSSHRIVRLVVLLAATAPSLWAQGDPEPGAREQDAGGDPAVRVQEPEDVAAEEQVRNVPAQLRSGPPIFVRVMQDPVRIAPGENGLLLLHVQVPQDGSTRVLPGGTSEHSPKQGDLALGPASFDPPPRGVASLRSFLVRIPISVAGSAKYGDHNVSGLLKLRGVFDAPTRAAGDDNPQAGDEGREAGIADGSVSAASPISPPTTPSNSSDVPWSGRITVGAPVPRPVVVKGSAGRGTEVTSSQTSDVANPEGASTGTGPLASQGAAPADVGGRRERTAGEPGTLDPVLPGKPQGSSTIFLVLAGAGVALLLLFFVLQGRSKA